MFRPRGAADGFGHEGIVENVRVLDRDAPSGEVAVEVIQVPDAAQVPERSGVLLSAVLAALVEARRLHSGHQPGQDGTPRVLRGVLQGGVAEESLERGAVVVVPDQFNRLIQQRQGVRVGPVQVVGDLFECRQQRSTTTVRRDRCAGEP